MNLPPRLLDALLWLHISGNIVWIGSILAVALVLAGGKGEAKVRGAIASDIYRRLSVPSFVVSFLCGAVRLGDNLPFYLKVHHWMHPKLALAATVIALHHVIGARARRTAGGALQEAGPVGTLAVVLAVAAIGAAFCPIFKFPD
jgi:protoporphyrinogen IX oxidase